MYSSVIKSLAPSAHINGLVRESTAQNSLNQPAGEFFEAFQQATSSTSESVTQTPANGRTDSQVDAAIKRDLKETFGIEPHQPGEPLRPLLDSMWTFQDLDDNGIISGSEIKTNLAAASEIFQKHLGRFIRGENISTRPPVELNTGSDGQVRVQDGHPDKEKIEKFINGNSELRNLYAGITSSRDLLAMAEESVRFQKRYAVDPKAAVAEFAHLFSGNYGYRTQLTIDGDNWSYLTTSSFSV